MKKQLFLLAIAIGFVSINAQHIMPTQVENLYSVCTENLYFEVNASFGGQVSSFKIDGQEILYFTGIPDDYLIGSTLWPSPQGVWNWPPSAELDREEYEARISGNTILMVSKKDPSSKLVFKKSFSANETDNCIDITYEIINKGDEAYEVAAWAVTRVPSAGSLSFFPAGDSELRGTNSFEETTEMHSGVVWYQQKKSDPMAEKFFSDGSEGWLAHVNKDNFLFIKHFSDVAAKDQAPGEGEIELYYKNEDTYIELENQSAYVKIPSGGNMKYSVKWFGAKLPSSIHAEIGNNELLKFTRDIIARSAIK